MQLLQKILVTIILSFVLVSCKQEPSLQKYYVENQEKQDFMVLDIPANIVKLGESTITPKQEASFKAVKKINFLGFKKSETNEVVYKAEKEKVSNLLKNESYAELMRFKMTDTNMLVKYLGTESAIDEVIVFGSDDKMGFGIVRILGNDMKPEDMITLIEAMRTAKIDDAKLKEIVNFFQ